MNLAIRSIDPTVSIIVPARNEEASLGRCLESLVAQTGIDFELIVVDDASSDRTREIAGAFSCVRVIEAGPLRANWAGKNNAAFSGASVARGAWLLFTDADTVHARESLERAVAEAGLHGASLLSYSPKQEVHGFWEKALMTVIFAELAAAFRPSDVSDADSPAAAANGQYLLISRDAYDAIGGHSAVAASLLEDVDLARVAKSRGYKIHFRYAGDDVRTRMYRSFEQLREGWIKNLALLFPSSLKLAALRSCEFLLVVGGLAAVGVLASRRELLLAPAIGVVALLLYCNFLVRIRKAHFSWDATALSIFGLPLFSYLLLRSRSQHRSRGVSWKGRNYAPTNVGAGVPTCLAERSSTAI